MTVLASRNVEVRHLGELAPECPLGQGWESLVKGSQASGIMQSLTWSAMKRKQGLCSEHIGIFEDEQLVGGAIFYKSTAPNHAGILVAPEGPVLPWDDRARSAEYLGRLKDVCQSYVGAEGIVAMRVEPRLPAPPPACFREFGRAPIDLVPRETLYVDLAQSEASLLAGMKPKGRYNISLAERHGVRISECTKGDAVAEFYEAVKKASIRDGFALESAAFFQNLSKWLCPAGLATILLAKHDGDLLGALLLITYGDRATYLYGGVTDTKRQLMGGYALQWAAMKSARARGCLIYDFYGYVPHRAPEHPYGRFSQFKSQFGGQPIKFMGAHDYVFIDRLADAFISLCKS